MIADHFGIRDLYGRYSDAAARQDVEQYLSCWSDNGVRLAFGTECRGGAALRAEWNQIWSLMTRMAFFTELGPIRVNGDLANILCYCREIIVLRSGELWKVVGRYDDTLARDGDRWRFQRREYELLIDETKYKVRR
jgi:ketosteroid isomerase-like protein